MLPTEVVWFWDLSNYSWLSVDLVKKEKELVGKYLYYLSKQLDGTLC